MGIRRRSTPRQGRLSQRKNRTDLTRAGGKGARGPEDVVLAGWVTVIGWLRRGVDHAFARGPQEIRHRIRQGSLEALETGLRRDRLGPRVTYVQHGHFVPFAECAHREVHSEAPDPTIRTLATLHRRLPLIGNQGRNQVEWAEHQEADEQGEREPQSAPQDPQRENGRTAFPRRIEPEVSRRAVLQHRERQNQLLPQHTGRAQNPGVTVGAAQEEPPVNRRSQQQTVNPFGRLLREIGNSPVAQAVLLENVGCGRKPGEISGEGSALLCESL